MKGLLSNIPSSQSPNPLVAIMECSCFCVFVVKKMRAITKQILLLSIFHSTQVLSQSHLNYGKVLTNKKFTCNEQSIQREGDTYAGYSTGLPTICQSKNEFEIRFFVAHRPVEDWDLFVLTYNNGTWTATRYWYDFSRKNHDFDHPIKFFTLRPKYGFDSLFVALKQNNVFTLPDQQSLKYKGDVNDGNIYFLTYKVNNKFRRYSFENPDIYKEGNKSMRVFENYDNIASLFYDDLSKD